MSPPPSRTASAGPQPRGDINPLNTLAPYLWPMGEPVMRARVVISLAMLALAKVATVYVPVIYKQAVDLISGGPGFAASALIAIVVAYGVVRILQQAFSELREFFFARVAQRSIRKVALRTFRHLHALSLRFHLDRQTGSAATARAGDRKSTRLNSSH